MCSDPLEKYSECPQLMHRVETSFAVWGLALLRDELFVSSILSRQLIVHSSTTFEQLRTMLLPEDFFRPRDLAACQLKNCLYLVEAKGYEDGGFLIDGSVVRVDVRGKLIKAWDISAPFSADDVRVDEAYNLSVTRAGSLLVACAHSLREYSCDGEMLRRIILPTGCDMPWQPLQLKTGDFLMTQSGPTSPTSRHYRIYTMNSSGEVLLSSAEVPDVPEEENFSHPMHSVRDHDGCVITADNWKNRVVVFSPMLIFLREIVGGSSTQEELRSPYRVLLDEASGRLFIGTYKNIFVYRVFN